MHNWRRYPSSNWYKIDQKTRFYIWCSVVVPSDATEKNRNIGAQLQYILYTIAQKRFWKIYFLYEFWCVQTCSFRAVFGLPVRNLTSPSILFYSNCADGFSNAQQSLHFHDYRIVSALRKFHRVPAPEVLIKRLFKAFFIQ